MKDFGARLKSARRDVGLTQGKLAQRVRRSHSWVSKVEKGEIAPDNDMIERLSATVSKALGDPPDIEPEPPGLAQRAEPHSDLDEAYDRLGDAIRDVVRKSTTEGDKKRWQDFLRVIKIALPAIYFLILLVLLAQVFPESLHNISYRGSKNARKRAKTAWLSGRRRRKWSNVVDMASADRAE
jgi:transcriptional regulator with XRE-family HTH domain